LNIDIDNDNIYDDDNLLFESYKIEYENQNKEEINTEEYDIVIIASPLQNSKIKFNKKDNIDLKNTDFIPHSNYYYFIKGNLKENFFENYKNDEIPGMLISYNITKSNNILYIKMLNSLSDRNEFKINSNNELSFEYLKEFFGDDFKIEYINTWEMAYPKLAPKNKENLPSFILSKNLFYLNAIESVASCMELSMISGKNIVNLLEQQYHPIKRTNTVKTSEL
jgi:hypothetical protein